MELIFEKLKRGSKAKRLSPLSTILNFHFFDSENILFFHLSRYINGKPGTEQTERRIISRVNGVESLYKDFCKIFDQLENNEEIAIHSLVKKENSSSKYHIPLIDFYNSTPREIYKAIEKLQKKYNYDFYVFKSGRSFHAYSDILLTDVEWKKFLGNILLLNTPKKTVVDVRWIGHSLNQGFSSLRLSCNTNAYLSLPTFSKKISRNHVIIS